MYPDDYAFPHDELTPCGNLFNQHLGLTKREYIAIEMMKAWITAQPDVKGGRIRGTHEHAYLVATSACIAADALIEVLKGE